MTANFRQQHQKMIELAENILETVLMRDAINAGLLGDLRLRFARATSQHFAEEDAAVIKAVADGRLCRSAIAARRKVTTLWRADIALCNSEWPTKQIIDAPGTFALRFQPLIESLRREAEIEEREIFGALSA